MNVSKLIYRNLLNNGVNDVFMYSGGSIMPLIDRFYNGPINYYVNSHEQNCGHAATGYAKSSGKTGVSIVTSGPGVTNSVTPLLDATNDCTPFVLISGNVSLDAMGTNAFQEAPSTAITKPVTKWSHLVSSPDEVNDVINEAFYIANSGKPGSVHIDIPKCILLSDTNNTKEHLIKKNGKDIFISKDMNEFANIILDAKKPIIYVGQGAKNASNQLRQLAIKYGIPVTSTLHGMGIFNEENPLSLKMCGMHGNVAANYALQESDCIIAVGSRFDDRTTGNLKKYAPKCKNFIHLNIEKKEINKVVNSKYFMIGECKDSLTILLHALEKSYNEVTFKPIKRNKMWINKVQTWCIDFPYEYDKADNNKIKTQDVLTGINNYIKNCGDRFIFTTGVGNHQMMATQYINWKYPGRFISSGSLGVMGAGLPYAIGAQIANPDKIVIDIDGDSSFNMTSTDLKTIVENDLPVKIVVLNNSTQDMVRVWETLFFNERITATTNKRNPSYSTLGYAYGIESIYLNRYDNIEKSIKKFMECDKAVILECNVEPDVCLPLVAPGAALDEMLLYKNKNVKDYSTDGMECPS